jgi:hypothetical protein
MDRIVNCHTHVFTIDHVPERFLPLGLPTLMRIAPLRWALRKLLHWVLPFTDRDQLDRYARFLKLTYRRSQREL